MKYTIIDIINDKDNIKEIINNKVYKIIKFNINYYE